MSFDLYDPENELMRRVYALDNYRIDEADGATDCYIYFSGNRVYHPHTAEAIENTILGKDRFEWTYRKANRRAKCIYVRDLYLQWYVTGVNARLNSIDRVIEFLREETKGYRVFTVGNSAGGYMAVIVGVALGAAAVFTVSGQFELSRWLPIEPLLGKYRQEPERAKYYSLLPMLNTSSVPVFYFYPDGVDHDCAQARAVEGLPNVYAFRFRSKMHGQTMYAEDLPFVLALEPEALLALWRHYGEGKKRIAPFAFSRRVQHERGLRGWYLSLHGFCVNRAKWLYLLLLKNRR